MVIMCCSPCEIENQFLETACQEIHVSVTSLPGHSPDAHHRPCMDGWVHITKGKLVGRDLVG